MSDTKRVYNDGRESITTRVPPDLLARLDHQADERVLGRTLLVTRAIRELVERLEPDSVGGDDQPR